jgi:hypothetical protein
MILGAVTVPPETGGIGLNLYNFEATSMQLLECCSLPAF